MKLSAQILIFRIGLIQFSNAVLFTKKNNAHLVATLNIFYLCIRLILTCLCAANIKCIEIQSSKLTLDKICALLGHYTASCGNCLWTFRDNVSVNNCHTTPYNIPEERRSH